MFAVEQVHGHAEIPLAAEDIEDLLVAEVHERMRPMPVDEGDLLREGRLHAAGQIVGDAAFFLHAQRRTALQIDGAAQRIRAAIRRVPLGEFDLVEHRARVDVDLRRAAQAVVAAREEHAVHRDGVQARTHPAHGEGGDEAGFIGHGGDAGQVDRDFARAHVRQIAERIHRRDVLEIGGVALRGDGGGPALALAGHLEPLEPVDARRQIEVLHGALPRAHGHGAAQGIETEVGDDDLVGARRHAGQHVAAGVVGERAQAERADLDAAALEQIGGRGVAHRTGDRAGGGGLGTVAGCETGERDEESCPKTNAGKEGFHGVFDHVEPSGAGHVALEPGSRSAAQNDRFKSYP